MLIDYFYQNRYRFFICVFSGISGKFSPLITLIPQIKREAFLLILVAVWYKHFTFIFVYRMPV
jgi:hypothetical protein